MYEGIRNKLSDLVCDSWLKCEREFVFTALGMPNFVSAKRHLQEILLHCFEERCGWKLLFARGNL